MSTAEVWTAFIFGAEGSEEEKACGRMETTTITPPGTPPASTAGGSTAPVSGPESRPFPSADALELLARQPWLPQPGLIAAESQPAAQSVEKVLRRLDELHSVATTAATDATHAHETLLLLQQKAAALQAMFAMVDSVEAAVHTVKTSVAQMERNVELAEQQHSSLPSAVTGFFSAFTKKKEEAKAPVPKPADCIVDGGKLFDAVRAQVAATPLAPPSPLRPPSRRRGSPSDVPHARH